MSWLNLASLGGWLVLAALAWIVGGRRRPVPWRTVAGGGAVIAAVAVLVFVVPWTRVALVWINRVVVAALDAGREGARFLFGPLALSPGETLPSGETSIGFVLATQILPAVIFFSALMTLLYHVGAVQPVVRAFARMFRKAADLSGAESLAGASNLFVGVESAMTVRPYLERMTRSELLMVLTCGMSTVASTTLAIYVVLLRDVFPLIAGHIVSASVLSIPSAALVAKLMLPESDVPETLGALPPDATERPHRHAMTALAAGAWDGLRLAAGIATLLIAVLGLLKLLDVALVAATTPLADALGGPIDVARVLGWLFTPLAWLLGIEAADIPEAARLLGVRAVATEIVAYRGLADLAAAGQVSARTLVVLSYALCGFAHVASVGVFVGGLSALAPSRREDLASLGFRALVAATIATLMTGAVAGMFYAGQAGVLAIRG